MEVIAPADDNNSSRGSTNNEEDDDDQLEEDLENLKSLLKQERGEDYKETSEIRHEFSDGNEAVSSDDSQDIGDSDVDMFNIDDDESYACSTAPLTSGPPSITTDTESSIGYLMDIDSPDGCLQMNLFYQGRVEELLGKIKDALAENRSRQVSIEETLNMKPDKPNIPVQSLKEFSRPYFKDKYLKHGAPPNADVQKKIENSDVDPFIQPCKNWAEANIKSLREAVKAESLSITLRPLFSKLDFLHTKLKKDEANESISKEVTETEEKILSIRSMDEYILLGERLRDDLNWTRIAVQLDCNKTEYECMLMWQNYTHPHIKKTAWTKIERDILALAVGNMGMHAWDTIGDTLGDRTAYQCFEFYQKNLNTALRKRDWTQEEDEILTEVVQKLRIWNHVPFTQVAYFLEGRTASQCLHRWIKALDPELKKGRWTKEEDQALIEAFKTVQTTDWTKISRLIPNRNDQQIRERWLIIAMYWRKGEFTFVDDLQIIDFSNKHTDEVSINWKSLAKTLHRRKSTIDTRYRYLCRQIKAFHWPKQLREFYHDYMKNQNLTKPNYRSLKRVKITPIPPPGWLEFADDFQTNWVTLRNNLTVAQRIKPIKQQPVLMRESQPTQPRGRIPTEPWETQKIDEDLITLLHEKKRVFGLLPDSVNCMDAEVLTTQRKLAALNMPLLAFLLRIFKIDVISTLTSLKPDAAKIFTRNRRSTLSSSLVSPQSVTTVDTFTNRNSSGSPLIIDNSSMTMGAYVTVTTEIDSGAPVPEVSEETVATTSTGTDVNNETPHITVLVEAPGSVPTTGTDVNTVTVMVESSDSPPTPSTGVDKNTATPALTITVQPPRSTPSTETNLNNENPDITIMVEESDTSAVPSSGTSENSGTPDVTVIVEPLDNSSASSTGTDVNTITAPLSDAASLDVESLINSGFIQILRFVDPPPGMPGILLQPSPALVTMSSTSVTAAKLLLNLNMRGIVSVGSNYSVCVPQQQQQQQPCSVSTTTTATTTVLPISNPITNTILSSIANPTPTLTPATPKPTTTTTTTESTTTSTLRSGVKRSSLLSNTRPRKKTMTPTPTTTTTTTNVAQSEDSDYEDVEDEKSPSKKLNTSKTNKPIKRKRGRPKLQTTPGGTKIHPAKKQQPQIRDCRFRVSDYLTRIRVDTSHRSAGGVDVTCTQPPSQSNRPSSDVNNMVKILEYVLKNCKQQPPQQDDDDDDDDTADVESVKEGQESSFTTTQNRNNKYHIPVLPPNSATLYALRAIWARNMDLVKEAGRARTVQPKNQLNPEDPDSIVTTANTTHARPHNTNKKLFNSFITEPVFSMLTLDGHIKLPGEIRAYLMKVKHSEAYRMLYARFRSLFAWPILLSVVNPDPNPDPDPDSVETHLK